MLEEKDDFSFIRFFRPFTSSKAVHFILVLGILAYFSSLFSGFVGDDNTQIVNNTYIRSLSNIPSFFTVSTFKLGNAISGIYYKPLLLIVFSLLYALFGLNPFFFHLFQIILGIANAVLVFLLLKKFIKTSFSFLLSLIFLIHPVNADVLVYISNTQDILFVFFGLLALLISASPKKNSRFLVLFFLTLSLLSKETGMAFVFLDLIYIFLFKKKQFKISLIPNLALLAFYIFIHTLFVGTGFLTSHIYHIGRLPLALRVLSIPKIIFTYLKLFFYPDVLVINSDWVVKNITLSDFWFPLALDLLFFLLLLFSGILLYRKNRGQFKNYLFFFFWFLLSLLFHLQIIPLDATVATRWFYLPFIGLLGVFGIILANFFLRPENKTVFYLILLLLVGLLFLKTLTRISDFKDNLTLMCTDAAKENNNFSLENSCGISLFSVGSYDKAQVHFEKSIKLAPYYGTNWFGLGITLGKKAELTGNRKLLDKSVSALKTAIKLEPGIPWAYESLGYLYSRYYPSAVSLDFLSSSVKKFPQDSHLWYNYAFALYLNKNTKGSLSAVKNAYFLNPSDLEAAAFYSNLSRNISPQIPPSPFKK